MARVVVEQQRADAVRLQTILDAVTDGIYGLDADGNTTFVNRAAARMLGRTARELAGAPQHDTIHHSRADGSPFPIDQCPIHWTLRDGIIRNITDDAFWRADGTSFPVSYTVTPIREKTGINGAVITFQDLTEQRRTETEAQRALLELVQEQAARAEAESMRVQLNRLFEQAPAHVAVTYGPDHVFELANPRYLELVGGRHVVGKPVREALPEVVAQGFIELLDHVYQSGQAWIGNEVAVSIDLPEGTRKGFFNFVYQPLLGGNGGAYGILIHAVDVTEQVRGRMEVERNASELSTLARQLERTNQELDQFAYIASHDLKAPLRGVSNIASWLEEDLADKLTDETREYVGLMKKRIERMEDLINALLTYSRAGRVRGEARSVTVGEIVAEVVQVMADQSDTPVTLDTSFPTLMADPVGVQQVFQNLISNALKYARSAVHVGVVEEEREYRFYVSDDGPGIDSRFHERIWVMFQRLHAPGEGEGTGIGLAIVKKIAEANHGRAWVESSAGAGSTFWVAWPKQ
jgi:PAS domain S-box-containing protein